MHIENVLSVFDGHSGLMISLEQAGFTIGTYYSSEIDKHAIKASNACYPNIIRLGDVRKISASQLPKIDVFGGGSPCQSFSFAGKRKGMATKCEIEILDLNHYLQLKSEQFEFEGESYLFWEYMRILRELQNINPNIKFFLENVEMGDKWEKVISKAIGVKGIHINSALVSAQNRHRIYWTNIGMQPGGLFDDMQSIITQPKDRGILMNDILESEVDEKYYMSAKAIKGIELHKQRHESLGNGFGACISSGNKKSNTILSRYYKDGREQLIACLKEVRSQEAKAIRKENNSKGIDSNPYRAKDIELRTDGKTGALLTSPTVDNMIIEQTRIRRLTPRECGRLQTIPEHIIDKILSSGVSDSQVYKMFGNGWNIETIVHILKYIKF